MNKSEIAAQEIWTLMNGVSPILGDEIDTAEVRQISAIVERAIADSQAPQPKRCPFCRSTRIQKLTSGHRCEECECQWSWGDGEPSPPLKEAKELFELYLGVAKSSDVNTYIDWYKRVNDWLKRNFGAAQEVSPSASVIRSDDPPLSCHVCGEIMVKWKCPKCGATTECSNEEVSPPIPVAEKAKAYVTICDDWRGDNSDGATSLRRKAFLELSEAVSNVSGRAPADRGVPRVARLGRKAISDGSLARAGACRQGHRNAVNRES